MDTKRGSESFDLCPQGTIGNDPAIRHYNGWPLWAAECMRRDDRGYCRFNKFALPWISFGVHWFASRAIKSWNNSYCILATFAPRGKGDCSKLMSHGSAPCTATVREVALLKKSGERTAHRRVVAQFGQRTIRGLNFSVFVATSCTAGAVHTWPLATDRIFMADGRFGWIVLQNSPASSGSSEIGQE